MSEIKRRSIRRNMKSEDITAPHFICNVCKQDFSLNLMIDDIEPDVEVHYFACPHCGQVYIYHVNDTKIREWRKQGVRTYEDKERVLDRQKILINRIYDGQDIQWVRSGGGV